LPIRVLDLTLPSPAENIALEEALLHRCQLASERGEEDAFLRLWESPRHFVVLGVACRLREEVEVERCHADDVPILRRASGGGTVLQGPGCLNYSLVLPLARWPRLRDVTRSYAEIIGRTAAALGLAGAGLRGSSDLALAEWKVGGSAQKRSRDALLFHGTILHAFDLALIPRYLREPERRPAYRGGRCHLDFVANAGGHAAEIRARLAAAWEAEPLPPDWSPPPVAGLIAEKYSRPEWTARF
jgi:lipoate-protein ligase A